MILLAECPGDEDMGGQGGLISEQVMALMRRCGSLPVYFYLINVSIKWFQEVNPPKKTSSHCSLSLI